MNTLFLNTTEEVIYCLKEAKKIVMLRDFSTYTLQPIHLCLSLLFNSTLIQKLLNIKFSKKQREIILNSLFNHSINQKVNKEKIEFSISLDILELFNILNINKFFFNSIILFYFLIKKKPILLFFLSNFLNIKNFNLKNVSNLILKREVLIPEELKHILSVIKGEKTILGRNNEIEKINEILSRDINRNICLIGDEGVGKFSIIKKMAFLNLKYIFIEINLNELIMRLNNNVNLTEFFFDFIRKYSNLIVYIRNIHLLFDSSTNDFNFLKHIFIKKLQLNYVQVIGTTLDSFYNKMVDTYKEFNFLFYKLYIFEPEKELLFSILKQYILSKTKEGFNNKILFLDSIIETLIDLSIKYLKNFVFPKKGLLLLDFLISKYKKHSTLKVLTKKDILDAISYYTNISTDLLLKEKKIDINNIEKNLKKCVFGQDISIIKISSALKRAYIGLKDKNKPIGSWLLCGPSGTGKTELVKSLAKLLFGSEKELIRFDMSEFMEKHSISKLIGSPPGYIGFDEGGLLTETVKNKPYSIILFDEIEKAHKDINNIMLQILDEGHLTDSKGQKIDFTNTLIIFTSNLGCPTSPINFNSVKKGLEISKDEYKFLSMLVNTAVKSFFKPEFINRLDSIIVFKPLCIASLVYIIDKFIYNLLFKLKENNILLKLEIDEDIKILLAKIAYHPLYGARPLKRVVEQFIEKPISEFIVIFKLKTSYLLSLFKDKENNINYSLKVI